MLSSFFSRKSGKSDPVTADIMLILLKLTILIGPFVAVPIANLVGSYTTSQPQTVFDAITHTNIVIQVNIQTHYPIDNSSYIPLLLAWALYMGRAFNENLIQSNYGDIADWFVLLLTIEKTAWFINPQAYTWYNFFALTPWLVLILCNIFYHQLYTSNLLPDVDNKDDESSDSNYDSKTKPDPLSFESKTALWLILSGWIGAQWTLGLWDPTGPDSYSFISTYTLYSMIDVVLAALLCLGLDSMQTYNEDEPLYGAGSMVAIFVFYELLPFSYTSASWLNIVVTLGGALFVLIATVNTRDTNDNIDRLTHTVSAIWRALITIVKDTVKSYRWLMLLYMVLTGYLLITIYDGNDWYTTNVTFVPALTTLLNCNTITSNIEGGNVQTFFQDTTGEDHEDALLSTSTLSFVYSIRVALRAFIAGSYPQLRHICLGFITTVNPGYSLVVLVTLLGPLYVTSFVALQMFPACEAVVTEAAFWGGAMTLTLLHAFFSFFLADIEVSVWYLLMPGISNYSRSYTGTGISIGMVEIVMCLISMLCLASILHQNQRHTTRSIKGLPQNKLLQAASTSLSSATKAIEQLFVASMLCKIASIGVLVVAVSLGSPFSYLNIEHTGDYAIAHPSYTAYDPWTDGFGAAAGVEDPELNALVGATQGILTFLDTLNYCVPDTTICVGVNDMDGHLASDIAGLMSKAGTALQNAAAGVPGIGIGATLNGLLTPQLTGFSILDSPSIMALPSLSTYTPSFSANIPIIDLNVNFNGLYKNTWFIITVIVIASLLVLIKFAAEAFPFLSAFEGLFVSGFYTLVLSLVFFIWTAQQVLITFFYHVVYTFSTVGWLYGLSFLLMFAGIATNSSSDLYDKLNDEVTKAVGGEANGYSRVNPYDKTKRSDRSKLHVRAASGSSSNNNGNEFKALLTPSPRPMNTFGMKGIRTTN